MSERIVRGLVLCSQRRSDGRQIMVVLLGSDPQIMTDRALRQAVQAGGSAHPQEWTAWTVDRVPDATLATEIGGLFGTAAGAVSHPAVIDLVVDANHPLAGEPS